MSGWRHISIAFVESACGMLEVAAEEADMSIVDLRAIMRQAAAMIRAAITRRQAEQREEESENR